MTSKYRKGIFIVTFAKTQKGIEYLILKRKLHWEGWEFPKGGVKLFETKKHAAKRELKEETGLKTLKIKKFGINGEYKYSKNYKDRPEIIGQTYKLYAAEVKKQKIKVDDREHEGHKWLDFKKAHKLITHTNQKKCLKVVDSWLKHEI